MAMNPEFAPTHGEPSIEAMLELDRMFVQAGLRPAPLRCGPHLLD